MEYKLIPSTRCRRITQYGFTLIEALIAIAVIAIAMAAIIKSLQTSTRDLQYLQNKTVAQWLGFNVMQEIRLGLLNFSENNLHGDEKYLNQSWYWTARLTATEAPSVKTVVVDVYLAHQQKLVELVSYLYENSVDQK